MRTSTSILNAAGLDRSHVAFVRIHLVDFERLIERVNKTYVECVGEGPLPARTAVGVSQLTRGALVEMDFVVRDGCMTHSRSSDGEDHP